METQPSLQQPMFDLMYIPRYTIDTGDLKQGTDEWKKARRDCLTSTDIRDFIVTSEERKYEEAWQTLLSKKLKQRQIGDENVNWVVAGFMRYGREHEELALTTFLKQTGMANIYFDKQGHPTADYNEARNRFYVIKPVDRIDSMFSEATGIRVSSGGNLRQAIGFSPDFYDEKNDIMIEVKCPSTAEIPRNTQHHRFRKDVNQLLFNMKMVNSRHGYLVYWKTGQMVVFEIDHYVPYVHRNKDIGRLRDDIMDVLMFNSIANTIMRALEKKKHHQEEKELCKHIGFTTEHIKDISRRMKQFLMRGITDISVIFDRNFVTGPDGDEHMAYGDA